MCTEAVVSWARLSDEDSFGLLFRLRSKTHRSLHELADARRDVDEKVCSWLLHCKHLGDAFRCSSRRILAIKERLCAPAPISARCMAVFDRRHGIESDRGKLGDVSGNRQRRLKLRAASRDRCETIMIVAP